MTEYTVGSGQTATGFVLSGGDTQTVLSGGAVIDTNATAVLNIYDPNNGYQLLFPSFPAFTYVGAGGVVELEGGNSTGTTLNESTENVGAGSVAQGTVIGSVLLEGQTYSSVPSPSAQNVSAGGTANATAVTLGTQAVYSGGTANNATVTGAITYGYHGEQSVPGGGQVVLSGGVANNTVASGGVISVSAGGMTSGAIVSNGGSEALYGTATATVLNPGGELNVEAGGVANASVVDGAHPIMVAPIPYYYFSTVLVPDGLNVLSGGTANGALVENNGNLSVASGGTVTSATVTGSGSMLVVNSGGVASATTVSTQGTESVSAGGTASFSVVSQGGTSAISGLALHDLMSGGMQEVLSGGESDYAAVSGGGTLTVMSGGTAGHALVDGFGTVANSGLLTSNAFGVYDQSYALEISNAAAVSNSGTIQGYLAGIFASGTGNVTVINNAGALITSQNRSAVTSTDTAFSLINNGVISVSSGIYSRVVDLGGGTLTNCGTIAGGGGSGFGFGVGNAGRLVLEAGSVIQGAAEGTGAASTLELASGPGTLTGLGDVANGYSGFGTVQVDAGQTWALNGASVLQAGTALDLAAGSTLDLTGGNLTTPSTGTIAFQGAATLGVSLQAQTGTVGISGFNTGSIIDATNAQVGSTVFALGSNDASINLADGYSPFILRFLGDSGRHLQLRQNQSLMGTLTLEPVATAIVAHPDMPGTLAAGNVVTFDVTPEVALSVDTTTGLPTLALNDGGVANYDQTASTSTNLVFRTTVSGAQSSGDLKVAGMSLGGASVVDAIGTTFDVSSVATLSGSNTGIVIAGPVMTTPTPPTTVTGGVTVLGGAGATVFITPKAGSNSVAATATGNDTVISQGTDTIQAGGGADVIYATGAAATVAGGTGSLTFEGGSGNDMVVGGSGSNAIYGGSGSNTFFGGTGSSLLVAGSGANNMLLAGVGNTTLVGGLGKAVMMFGGPGADSFVGSSGGSDIMVGGAGGNSFSLTNGDVAFGGPIKADTFTAGNGAAMITTGSGGAQVNLGSGTLTSFEGSGAVNYSAGKGEGGTTDIVGFTVHDHITLTGGFTSADATTAFTSATKGSFGTTLSLTDGTKITVFGVNLAASQISVG